MQLENPKYNFLANTSSMLMSGAFQFLIAFGSNLVLVRLLAPEEFGEFAYTLAIATVATVLLNFRIGDYVARASALEITRNKQALANITALQTVFVVFASSLALVYFGMFDAAGMLILISLLISPAVNLQMNLYERQYSYSAIAKIESVSNLASHSIAIGIALLQGGAYALYFRLVCLPVFIGIGLYLCGGITKLNYNIPTRSDVKLLLSKSKWNWLDGTLEQLTDRLIILGSKIVMSFEDLGFFYQSRRLAAIPHQFLSPATTRVFLRHSADTPVKLQFIFLMKMVGLELIALGSMFLLFFFFGEQLINLLFGLKWSILYDVVLALAGVFLFNSPYNTLKAHYISINRVREFIVLARIPFILILGASAFLFTFMLNDLTPLLKVSLSLSVSYFVATLILLGHSSYLALNLKDEWPKSE